MTGTTPIRLADAPALTLAGLAVAPASRTLRRNDRELVIEPRTMQVLVLLATRRGEVVGRQALIDGCWDGLSVSEDAVNRAILKLRRALDELGSGIAIETVPRVGYRLVLPGNAAVTPPRPIGRRGLIVGGGATGLVAAAGAAWLIGRRPAPRPPRARELYERGEAAFQQGARDDNAQAVAFFQQAAALAPDDAPIAGALALALRFEQSFRGLAVLAQSTALADRATARALALDPRDPDAIAARSMYLPFRDHWLETERRLRAGLREAPDSGVMNGFLGMVLADVGRTREAIAAFQVARRGAFFVPLLREYLVEALFAAGRLGDADRELEAAQALWPQFDGLWWLRFWTQALTGRTEAARAHLAARAARPNGLAPEQERAAALAVLALEDRAPAAIDAALAAWQAVAVGSPRHWRAAIGLAAALGRLDTAMTMLDAYLAPYSVRPMPRVPPSRPLFDAPLAPLRVRPSFWGACDRIGLARYWRDSGTRPDART